VEDKMTINVETAIARHRQFVNSGMARLMSLMGIHIEQEGAGCYVYDNEGTAYLDCGGYCVFLLGHRHPEVIETARKRLERNPLSSRVLINNEQSKAAKALISIAPNQLDYVWFANSGAEAVEAALKLAKLNGVHNFIAMKGGFHGKTLGALSITHNENYRKPFLPLLPNVSFTEYGNINSLETSLKNSFDKCCVIVEPIQSEAGVISPPVGYLKNVELLCKKYGALLIVDEISTGLGRLGQWWGISSEQVSPDILLCGKALSGGVFPVSAMLATSEVFSHFNKNPLLHTSTFAGNPMASDIVLSTINILKRDDIPEVALSVGLKIKNFFIDLQKVKQFKFVKDIRCHGLLIGLEFIEERFAGEFIFELLTRKIITSHSLNNHKTVRLTPSALLRKKELIMLFSAIEESLDAIENRLK